MLDPRACDTYNRGTVLKLKAYGWHCSVRHSNVLRAMDEAAPSGVVVHLKRSLRERVAHPDALALVAATIHYQRLRAIPLAGRLGIYGGVGHVAPGCHQPHHATR